MQLTLMVHPDWCCEGRGGLDSWFRLGYIPVQDFDYKGFGTMTRSISRTLEYSYNDFCISRMAAGLGHTTDVETYQEQSENWLNLYKADQTSYLYNGSNTVRILIERSSTPLTMTRASLVSSKPSTSTVPGNIRIL